MGHFGSGSFNPSHRARRQFITPTSTGWLMIAGSVFHNLGRSM